MEKLTLLSERLKWAVAQKEKLDVRTISQSELASIVGKSRTAVNNWYQDKNGMDLRPAMALGEFLQINAEWLATGKGTPQPVEGKKITKQNDLPSNSYMVDKNINKVPVVGKSMGGLPEVVFTDEGRPIDGYDEYAEVYSGDPQAFVTRVDGNSMYPKYVQGEYALVEPNTPPEVGDDVIVRTKSGHVMLKRLSHSKGLYELSSYNDPEIHKFEKEDIAWIYYVAYPVPAKKIKSRL